MGAVKDAIILRQMFAKAKKAEGATMIQAIKAEIGVHDNDWNANRRIKTFQLMIEHADGMIIVPVTMEQLKRWVKELKDAGDAMWYKSQGIRDHDKHRMHR